MSNRTVLRLQQQFSIALSFLFLAFSPVALSQEASPASTHAERENEIREALVRYLAADWSQSDYVFFISIEGNDPSNQFLLRLKGFTNPIKKVSESKDVREEKSLFSHVRDKATDTPGIVFSVGRIVWLSRNAAEVPGSYRCGSICGGGSTYRVKREGRKWVISPGNSSWNA
jgi:hypothetical protein